LSLLCPPVEQLALLWNLPHPACAVTARAYHTLRAQHVQRKHLRATHARVLVSGHGLMAVYAQKQHSPAQATSTNTHAHARARTFQRLIFAKAPTQQQRPGLTQRHESWSPPERGTCASAFARQAVCCAWLHAMLMFLCSSAIERYVQASLGAYCACTCA